MNHVEIVADSKNQFGQRITSIVATFPRMLLAEVNTHRVFSRNSASSRAIRFQQMVKNCQDNPFIPFRFQKDHAGMQGTEYFEGKEHDRCRELWLDARNSAIVRATELHNFGVTKQLANRILEPFQWHTALITSTEWENFINLRVSEFAEDHFQDLSQKILDALNESEPKQLKAGEWHIPFGDKLDFSNPIDFVRFINPKYVTEHPIQKPGYIIDMKGIEELKVKLATVRCARISYLNQGKETSIEDDLKLHDRLASSGHWSAFEHCARAMSDTEYEEHSYTWIHPATGLMDTTFGICGNFTGFIQYRKMFLNENRSDSRLIKK